WSMSETVARRTFAFDPLIAITVIEFERKARIDGEDVSGVFGEALWLLRRRLCLSLEYRIDGCLRAFLAIAARHAHCADDLTVHHDGHGARLRKIVHKRWCQVFTAADNLVGLRRRTT